ncbi:PaaI family thioesterase [Gordonia sp. NPDC127522]|uniref:PaaI family thioesterase n=1 Tax=Gordonia sp. NPDC127522 TaxID=3345390 RepID=UPI0036402011
MQVDMHETTGNNELHGPAADEQADGDEFAVLCPPCRRSGRCRMGMRRETAGDDGQSIDYELICGPENEGGPGVAHGGWISGVFVEIVGHLPLHMDQLVVTGALSVTYLKPVPIGRPLTARAWLAERADGKWTVRATIRLALTGTELANATATLVEREMSHYERTQRWLTSEEEKSHGVA